ncbi:MAG TPA: trigger factor [Phycisphaerae bacterium]|nr:trigger factor [Phycisphaerae bacterium]
MSEEPTATEETQEEKTPISVVVEDSGTLKKKVTVTVPADRITAKRDELYGELNTSAVIPGFRVGHAPRRLLEKRFGKEVGTDVRNGLVGDSLGEAIEDAELKTLGEPELKIDDIVIPEQGDLEYSFEVEVEPEVEMPELDGIELKKETETVDEAKIDDYIENIRQGQARYTEAAESEPAQEGDSIVASAKITGDGIEFENPRVMLRVAPSYVEGIALPEAANDLLGKKTGDVVTIKTTVPESHAKEDWQNKEVSIELTVNKVSHRHVPELNEEFAKQMGFDSIAELKKYVGERLEANLESQTQQKLRQQVCDYLLEKTSFEMPEGLLKRQTAYTLQRQVINLMQMGVPQEKVLERKAEMESSAREEAHKSLRLSFILGKVAEKNKTEVNESEINSRVAQIAMQYGRRPERMRQELAADGSLGQVAQALLEEKVIDSILETAKIEEVAAAKAEKKPAAKKAAKKTAKKAEKKDAE